MALIGKIRSNAGLMVVVIGLAMAAFVLTELFTGLRSGFGQDQNVMGSVFGEDIEQEEFNKLYNINLENEQGDVNDPEVRGRVAQRTWDGYVNQVMFRHEYDQSGFDLTGKEVLAQFLNPGPGSVITNIPSFKDSTGRFNPALVQQALQQSAELNPEEAQSKAQKDQMIAFKDFMDNLEEYLYLNRLRDKYFKLIKSGASVVSTNEAKYQVMQESEKRNITYLLVRYASVEDAEVNVTENDLRKYYDDHREEFIQEKTEVDVQFVRFDKVPAARDTASAKKYIAKVQERMVSSVDDSSFASSTNGVFSNGLIGLDALPSAARNSITEPDSGKVYGPFIDQEASGYSVFKISDMENGDITSYRIRHIQLNWAFSKEDTLNKRTKANGLRNELTANPGLFDEKAKEATETGFNQVRNPNLGWVGSGTELGEDFYKGLQTIGLNQFGVVESSRGIHVVQVLEASNARIQLLSVSREIFPGSETLREIGDDAREFARLCFQKHNIDTAARMSGENVRSATGLTTDEYNIPGLVGAKDIIKWALKAEESEISKDILSTDNAYVIAQVVRRRPEGYKDFEDIKDDIVGRVTNLKKAEYIKKRLKEVAGEETDLNKIKDLYGAGAEVKSETNITFNTASIPGLGTDPYIIGKIARLQQAEVSYPLTGTIGVMMLRCDQLTPGTADESAISVKKVGLGLSKANEIENNCYNGLKEVANVKDNRASFDY